LTNGLHQIRKLLAIKGNNDQIEDIACKTGKNLCQLFIEQRLKFRTYKELKNEIHKE
jgi:hypothetical protein